MAASGAAFDQELFGVVLQRAVAAGFLQLGHDELGELIAVRRAEPEIEPSHRGFLRLIRSYRVSIDRRGIASSPANEQEETEPTEDLLGRKSFEEAMRADLACWAVCDLSLLPPVQQ